MYRQKIEHKFPADLLMKAHLSNANYHKLDFRDCKVCKFDPSKFTEPCEIYRFSMRNFILFLWNVDFLQISISKAICLMICKEILQRPVNILNVDWLKFCSNSNSALLALFSSLKIGPWNKEINCDFFLQTFQSMISFFIKLEGLFCKKQKWIKI